MSKQFYFGTPDDTNSDLFDNDEPLPFPKPLERSAFLVPEFSSANFLASLSDRFQTLEDLQNELRELAQSLNKELIDLVNNNYQDFLSLGSTLSGGEEKIEDIRVGLMGFQRDVNGVRDKVISRKEEISALLNEKREIRREINKGIKLLNFAERIDDLEYHLGIAQPQQVHNEDSESTKDSSNSIEEAWYDDLNDDEVFDESTSVSSRLGDAVRKYRIVQSLHKRYDPAQPFMISQSDRLRKILNAIQLDLDAAVRQETEIGAKQKIIKLKTALDS